MRATAVAVVLAMTALPAWAQDGPGNAYAAYSGCMAAHVRDYALRAGPPPQLAGKIALLCHMEETAIELASIADHLASDGDADAAATQGRLVAQQIISAVREVTRLQIETVRVGGEP